MDDDQDTVVIDEMIDDDLYVSGGTVEINDDVSGDLVAFGAQVTVNDDIYGDALVIGGIVNINGDIRGSLYIGAGIVSVDGNIDQDLNIGGGTVTVNGNVKDDLRVGAGKVDIKSDTIGGDVLIGASQGGISKDTTIAGDQIVEIGPEAAGQKTSLTTGMLQLGGKSALGLMLSLLRDIAVLIGWLIIGWLLFKFVPVKSRKITDILSEKNTSIKILAAGVLFALSLVIIVPILVILAIFGIGQPALILFLACLGVASTVAGIYSATGLMRMVIRLTKDPKYERYLVPMLLGVTAYQVLGWIPCCMGLAIKILITIWGIGGILVFKWHMLKESKK